MRIAVCLVLIVASLMAPRLLANGLDKPESLPGYLAQLQLHSPQDLENALKRAEMLFVDGRLIDGHKPVSFVVHGPEVSVFFRENYDLYKPILDLAAKLTAFNVIDIRICETRMGVLGRDKSVLVPFVGTVPFGPAEESRLINAEEFVYF